MEMWPTREREASSCAASSGRSRCSSGALGGFELRPTRCFLWAGSERAESERVLSLGVAPRSLTIPRRERRRETGAIRVRTLGNPIVTVALASVHLVRRARAAG